MLIGEMGIINSALAIYESVRSLLIIYLAMEIGKQFPDAPRSFELYNKIETLRRQIGKIPGPSNLFKTSNLRNVFAELSFQTLLKDFDHDTFRRDSDDISKQMRFYLEKVLGRKELPDK
jgi:hypothetical protein